MGDDFTSSKIKCNELKIAPPWFPIQMNNKKVTMQEIKNNEVVIFLHVYIIKKKTFFIRDTDTFLGFKGIKIYCIPTKIRLIYTLSFKYCISFFSHQVEIH